MTAPPNLGPAEAELVRAVVLAASDALRSGLTVEDVAHTLVGCGVGLVHAEQTQPGVIEELTRGVLQ